MLKEQASALSTDHPRTPTQVPNNPDATNNATSGPIKNEGTGTPAPPIKEEPGEGHPRSVGGPDQHNGEQMSNPGNKYDSTYFSGEGIVALHAIPNPFLMNKICLNQI